jgi:TetR/AcrR family transcriptional repressor of nem operon
MRYSAKHKQETRDRIVRAASRRFRGRGEKRVAIADLMQELNLTHGGFYRHFESKQDLFAESMAAAFEEAVEKLRSSREKGRAGYELRGIIERYLSPEHCANSAEGCPLAALAPEIARQPRAVRLQFEKAIQNFANLAAQFLPGSTEGERQRNCVVLFSGMAGALSMARAVANESTRHRILQGAREFYIRSFCS